MAVHVLLLVFHLLERLLQTLDLSLPGDVVLQGGFVVPLLDEPDVPMQGPEEVGVHLVVVGVVEEFVQEAEKHSEVYGVH